MNLQADFLDGAYVHVFTNEKVIKEPNDIVADSDNYLHVFTENDSKEYGLTTKKCHIYASKPVEKTYNGRWYVNVYPDEEGVLQKIKYQRRDILSEMGSSTEQEIIFTTDPELIDVPKFNDLGIKLLLKIINQYQEENRIVDHKSMTLMNVSKIEEDINVLCLSILQLQQQKIDAVKNRDYSEAANYKKQEFELRAKLPSLKHIQKLYSKINENTHNYQQKL